MSAVRTPSREFAAAAAHDAAGRHDEAVNALALGTQGGDLACKTLLGKRLLVGDRAPALPKEGVRFLVEAATQGHAEAATRVATLCALGYGVPQDWREALRLYARAAALGWGSAQQALAALLAEPGAAQGAAAQPARGPEAVATLDLGRLLGCAAGQTVSESPLLRAFPQFIPAPLCDWVIDRSRHRLVRAEVYDPHARQRVVTETRSNTTAVFNLLEAEVPDILIQARMSAACGLPIRQMEAPAILHYSVGEQITDHYDFVSPDIPDYAEEVKKNGQRVITFLVYLNDDYEGGETAFPQLGIAHRGAKGSAMYFVNAQPDGSPDLRTLHAGRPPRSGEKWIISQFIRGHAMLPAGA